MTHVHLIGIGGTGLSAIAKVLLERGYTVSGSDMQASPLAETVKDAGAQVFIGHAPENISGADLIVRSSAIPDGNVEVQSALQHGIPVLKRADFLGQLMNGHLGIAVAGTHGKTTTTGMIVWVLTALDQDPSFIVGGVVSNLSENARAGQGDIFVIEADEYDRMFLGLTPQLAVVTNVEHDHPDIFPTLGDFEAAFQDFISCIKPGGVLLLCGDDPGAIGLLPEVKGKGIRTLTYGINGTDLDYQAKNLRLTHGSGYAFDIEQQNPRNTSEVMSVHLGIPGKYNVQNALAAYAVADQLQLPLEETAAALSSYEGTGRRFDVRGEAAGVLVIDDYAHHPSEIRATIKATREVYPDRDLWVVWQPHTYSRTKLFLDAFATSFVDAPHLIVSDVYQSREPIDPDFSVQRLIKIMRHKDAHYVPEFKDQTSFLLTRLNPGDVLLVLSAGDADQVSAQVFAGLMQKG